MSKTNIVVSAVRNICNINLPRNGDKRLKLNLRIPAYLKSKRWLLEIITKLVMNCNIYGIKKAIASKIN